MPSKLGVYDGVMRCYSDRLERRHTYFIIATAEGLSHLG